MNFKKLNEKLEKFIESNLPNFQKIDKLCDTDKRYTESGRYLIRKDSKYGIYIYKRTTQKFNGSWNYDYKLISPEFNKDKEAIQWLADKFLSLASLEELKEYIEEGSFKIYNNELKQCLGLLDTEEGTWKTSINFPSHNKGIDPVPNYMLEPNKAKANNLKRDYIQTHGKEYKQEL